MKLYVIEQIFLEKKRYWISEHKGFTSDIEKAMFGEKEKMLKEIAIILKYEDDPLALKEITIKLKDKGALVFCH